MASMFLETRNFRLLTLNVNIVSDFLGASWTQSLLIPIVLTLYYIDNNFVLLSPLRIARVAMVKERNHARNVMGLVM